MRIKILHFKIQQTFSMTENMNVFQMIWRSIFGPDIQVDYHFDVVMKIDPDYIEAARQLEKDEHVQLPNGVRLQVWSIDRGNIIKAKTYKMIQEDLRGYRPMEMFLVYPRVHGHLSDKAV